MAAPLFFGPTIQTTDEHGNIVFVEKFSRPISISCDTAGSTVDPLGYAWGIPFYSEGMARKIFADHDQDHGEFVKLVKDGIIPMFQREKP